MNVEEFLTFIWNTKENQAATTSGAANNTASQISNNNGHLALNNVTDDRGISNQLSLPRQGLLTLPTPVCEKTVNEVRSQIHDDGQQGREQSDGSSGGGGDGGNVQNPKSAPQELTFGEMTLEDFLIKAGVVREKGTTPLMPLQQQQYGMYQGENNNLAVATGSVSVPMLGMVASSSGSAVCYQMMPLGAMPLGESTGGNCMYPPIVIASPTTVYGGRVRDGSGCGSSETMGVVGPVSLVSSNGMMTTVDNAANQYGMDMCGLKGRKRITDGSMERTVERRQHRMIKNRVSAARSRARKQAYEVELELELNHLKEENGQLKQALAELERKKKATDSLVPSSQ